jgi:putative membrane protein
MQTNLARAGWVGLLTLGLTAVGARAADDARINDSAFVRKASGAGIAEIKAGEIATQRANDAKVKAFAQRVIDDHTRANKELERLASRKGWTLSNTIDEKCQKELDKLSSTTAQEFDRTYMEGQLKAHEEAVKLFQSESENGQDADLKAWAGKILPTLREHLQMAKEACEKKDR